MKRDVTELKKMFVEILQNPQRASSMSAFTKESLLNEFEPVNDRDISFPKQVFVQPSQPVLMNAGSGNNNGEIQQHEDVEESLNIMDKEKELIIKALKKHKSKRKDAASDLGISERTLYRKLKEYDISE